MKKLFKILLLTITLTNCTSSDFEINETENLESETIELIEDCTEFFQLKDKNQNGEGGEPVCWTRACSFKPVKTCLQCPGKPDCCKKKIKISIPDGV